MGITRPDCKPVSASTSKCECFLIEVLVSAEEILGEKRQRGWRSEVCYTHTHTHTHTHRQTDRQTDRHTHTHYSAIYASYLALIGK